jgi:hypothetical protein
MGQSSFQAGALSTATEHFQKALVLDDLEQARIVRSFTGHDLGIQVLYYFGRTLAVLGFLHQSRLRRDELLMRGTALGHTPSRALSWAGVFGTSWLLRDKTEMIRAAETLRRIVVEERFPLYLAYSSIYTGWLEIEMGNREQGCHLICEGLAALDALGAILNQYFFMLFLANGQLRSGRIDDGLDTLDRAESLITKTGSRWCEAEVHRLRGDLQLARSAKQEAETSYLQAITIARSQDASFGRSARQPRLAVYGVIKASAMGPATFLLWFIIGSRRASTHRTSWTRRRFWISCSKSR